MIQNSNLIELLKSFLSSGSASGNPALLKQQLEAVIEVFNTKN